jgi:hypothetical protein
MQDRLDRGITSLADTYVLITEVRRLQADVVRLRAEVERLRSDKAPHVPETP